MGTSTGWLRPEQVFVSVTNVQSCQILGGAGGGGMFDAAAPVSSLTIFEKKIHVLALVEKCKYKCVCVFACACVRVPVCVEPWFLYLV